jgi:NADH-quinone oxidoreductase subunit M
MRESIINNAQLHSGKQNTDTYRNHPIALRKKPSVLSAAYILWMYKRIFFGKIPEQYAKIGDSDRYVTVTMAALAAITLFLGVYPNPMLNPITDYVQEMFSGDNTVLQIGTAHPANVSSSYLNNSNSQVTVAGGDS